MTAGVRDKVSGILFFRSPFSRQVKSHVPEPSMCLYRAKLREVDIKITTEASPSELYLTTPGAPEATSRWAHSNLPRDSASKMFCH